MKTVAAILTVFNRKEKTLECLEKLYNQQIPEAYELETFMVDDGCTDGTPDAVAENFPMVKIIKGSGDLFWNRGMHLAWKAAVTHKKYDFYLWLNDDTFLFEGALNTMLKNSESKGNTAIICGTTQNTDGTKLSYGGSLPGKGILEPSNQLRECSYMNGNFVLVPEHVYNKVGLIDPVFRHSMGDLDYGLRAKKKGIKIFVASQIIGVCDNHDTQPKWCLPDTPIIKRYKSLYSPLANSHPYYFYIYELRHYGIFIATKHFFSIHLRATFPKLWKI